MSGNPTVIIGGGLIGLASAHALLARGESVRIVEALPDIGTGTSFANGGLVTPSMSEPWNAPGAYRHFAGAALDPAAPMKLRLLALPGLVRWGFRFLRHSTPARYAFAAEASFRLATLSVRETRSWRERLGLAYDARASGSLSLFRKGSSMQDRLAISHHLQTLGLRFTKLDADAAVALEPMLGDIAPDIDAALYFPDDEIGDGHALCAALGRDFVARGGQIDTRRRVSRILVRAGNVQGVEIDGERVPAMRVIVAAGVGSVALLRDAGVRIDVAPAKGYSLTVDFAGRAALPSLPVSDSLRHVVATPLGQRLRIAGTAEFAGDDLRLMPERIAPLAACMRELYPRLAREVDPAQGIAWAGLRPVSADGLPYIGETAIDGLYVNAGHGALGLTLAAGSGRLLAELIHGATAAVDPAPYSPLRR
ncbi:MAG: FAD-dependent oxidoreductase [Steroidobacterales bacterium]